MITPLKVMVCLGTRPEVVKLSPVIYELQKRPGEYKPIIINTAQHLEMSTQFLSEFNIIADANFNIMSKEQSLSDITTRILTKMQNFLKSVQADCLLVQGDTSTAFTCALASYYHRIPVGHVESGLRTHDITQPFPEELNRQMISRIANWHFAPTQYAKENLLKEGIDSSKIYVTGNTVIDALNHIINANIPSSKEVQDILSMENKVLLVTIHRRESLGSQLESAILALAKIAKINPELEIVFPVHPNPKIRLQVESSLKGFKNIKLIPPQSYSSFINLIKKASLILTDSGGIQEEASHLGKMVLVLRDKTCRPESVENEMALVVGTNSQDIEKAVSDFLSGINKNFSDNHEIYGDGKASERIVAILGSQLKRS